MKFLTYMFVALLPLLVVVTHDIVISLGGSFEFASVGYYIYNYTPSLFYFIKNNFADSAMREFISGIMKSSLFVYCFFISGGAALYLVRAKINNQGPFRNYLDDIPELQKNWMNNNTLGSRFSGGQMHKDPKKPSEG